MRWLNRLSLSDLPQLRTIDGIEALENLSELHLSGNLGALYPPLRLDSVKAISKLAALEKVEFLNIRLENDDISFVASSFPKLRNLTLSNEFERVQFAFLAKRLNAQLAEPIAAYAKLNVSCQSVEVNYFALQAVGCRLSVPLARETGSTVFCSNLKTCCNPVSSVPAIGSREKRNGSP